MTLTRHRENNARTPASDAPGTGPVPERRPPARTRHRASIYATDRTIIGPSDMRRFSVRFWVRVFIGATIFILVIIGAGPLLWLAKSAVSTTQDIVSNPMGLWDHGIHLENLSRAWNELAIGTYTWNTFVTSAGTMITSVVLATTGAYVLEILKPAYGRFLNAAVMATLFIPGIISLVPLYLTIVHTPIINVSLMNSYWAIWLPCAVNAFNVMITKQYFASLPLEMFEAARVDGAGPFRVFWSLVLPMSKPIVGVVALLSFMATWKDFLWPKLVLPDPSKRTLSVALDLASRYSEQNLVMAGMFIATVVPVVLFLLFQNQFLKGVGATGAIKG